MGLHEDKSQHRLEEEGRRKKERLCQQPEEEGGRGALSYAHTPTQNLHKAISRIFGHGLFEGGGGTHNKLVQLG